jgi:hypothetical protein
VRALLKRINWKHALGLFVTLTAAGLTEVSGVKHTVVIVALTGIATRLDKILKTDPER